jgi:PAS domain S-box-containing protein
MAMDDPIQPLRVLQVEGSARDAERVQQALASGGMLFSVQRVQTGGELLAALAQVDPDIVLCDSALTHLDGKEALRLVRQHAPHVPVLMVTGTLGDEAACELLKLGARDVVPKDRLARLGPAVRRALAEERGIRARKAAEAAVRESEVKFRRLFQGARDGLLILDARTGRILDANSAVEDLLVAARQDLVGKALGEVDTLKALPDVGTIRRELGLGRTAPACIRVQPTPGRSIDLEAVFSWYGVDSGEHILCDLRDMTERRHAEAALRKSEVLFRAIVEHAFDMFFVTDADGVIRYASQAVARIAGYVPEGTVGARLRDFVSPDQQHEAGATWCRILASPGEPVRSERKFIARDGSTRWVESVAQNLLEDPALRGVVVVLRDITERQQAEAALRDSEVRFRALIESASDILAVIDAQGVVQYVSPAVKALAGYDPAELVGRRFFDVVHPDDVTAVGTRLGGLLGKPGAIVRTEQRFCDKAGNWHAMEVLARNLLDTPPINGIVVNMRDVTDRKAVEERLRMANLAVERSQTVVFRWREAPDWPIAYVSGNVDQWGYAAPALMAEGVSYAAMVHPADTERVQHEFASQFEAGISPMLFEYRIRTAQGAWRWVEGRATVERDGSTSYYQGTVQDITARRAASEELRSSRAALAEAQAIARLGNWTLDIASGDIAWSDESYRILGVDRAAFIPTYASVTARIHPDDRPAAETAVQNLMDHGAPMSLEHRILMEDGRERWVHERAIAAFDNDGRPLRVTGTVQDITERREAQLALSETLARVETQLVGVGAASTAEAISAGDLYRLAPILTEVAARTLGAGRTSVWLFNEAGTELTSVDVFAAATSTHSTGQVLAEPEFREQFEAMRGARYIDASDAQNDPRTRGYAEKYLKPLNVGALLDAIVRVDGKPLGMLKIAHVGGTRAWKRDEIAFACQLADKIGFAMMTRKRGEMEEQLRRSNRALRTLSAGNTALVHGTDEGELYRQMCRIAVEVGGYGTAWVGLVEGGRPLAVVAVAAEPGRDAQKCAAAQLADGSAVRCALREGIVQADRSSGRDCVVLPLKHGTGTFGVLVIGQEGSPIEADEQPTLFQLANNLAFGVRMLRTRAAHERGEAELRETMESTIHAIAGTVERRDLYTAGHQRRVAVLATAIGRELGLSADRLHGIGLAATIHDVGKVMVPAEILTKPGRLSPLEYDMVKQHAQAGYEIIKDVRFPWPIAEMVRQHHERMDGSGYPRGLKGDEILFEARIIGIADVLEAIASHRPYRPSLGAERALAEIETGRGTRYDAQVVDACLRLFREQGYQMPT